MTSSSAVVCHEIFDENSQPSAEEISEYAQQLGIDPESESHLLPLARDGLMQALPAPWKAYFDEKLQTHYYYNEESKKTQWEHPLDNVYRELVKKSRDASVLDDTCASVQELLTSEEYTKNFLERVETKVESDEDLSTDSGDHVSDVKETASSTLAPGAKRLTPLGRPPLAPLSRLDKKLADLKISPLRRSIDNTPSSKPSFVRNSSGELFNRPTFERPKMLFKQQSEIIDLKMHVLKSPEEDNFSPLLSMAKVEKGLQLTGKGSMFLKASKSDFPSPDTEKSLPFESLTKSDPPKGILREKLSDTLQKKAESVTFGKPKHIGSFEEDRKSVRFKLENTPDPTVSPGSNSSSELNEAQSSIISATPAPTLPSPTIPSSSIISPSLIVPTSNVVPSSPAVHSSPMSSPALAPLSTLQPVVLAPLVARPPLPPRPLSSDAREKSLSLSEKSLSEKDSMEIEIREVRGTSPGRRLLRPPAADYIKPDLFQKNFQKISDLVRPSDIDPTPVSLEELTPSDKEARPRSPMIPQKNKISINLMESIESETSIDSPDAELANLDLNDLDISIEKNKNDDTTTAEKKDDSKLNDDKDLSTHSKLSNAHIDNVEIPQIKVPKLDLLTKLPKSPQSDSDDSKKISVKEETSKTFSRKDSIDVKEKDCVLKISPTSISSSDLCSPKSNLVKPWSSPLSTFKPSTKTLISPLKSSDSNTTLSKPLTSPRLDGLILSQEKPNSDNVVVVYQFETENKSTKPIKSLTSDMTSRDMIERNKADERKRLELALQKELESMRVEWTVREKRMRLELQEELKLVEEKFIKEKEFRLSEQTERHRKEMEVALATSERNHETALAKVAEEFAERLKKDTELMEKQYADKLAEIREKNQTKLDEQEKQLHIESERALSSVREQLRAAVSAERARLLEDNRAAAAALRADHTARLDDLKADYRAEVERLRSQHACHLEELRARARRARRASRVTPDVPDAPDAPDALHDKYRCLKEKYARLKHDVKLSIERRNKRREMSMTTGSETEKSNSHKATHSLERCKELNETSVSATAEPEAAPGAAARNGRADRSDRCDSNVAAAAAAAGPRRDDNDNDNDTSRCDSDARRDNNNRDRKLRADNPLRSSESPQRAQRRATVAFREPPRRRRAPDRDAVTTDFQDSSDATTADEKPKESLNGHGRRRCFTRLKSASTSRLNYSPKRGEGWSSPLESLRQQLRKLDDLEDQFPDLQCQPAYSLRYPFAELGAVSTADTAELEFVRHRALVEREGMRRARAALQHRRRKLRDARARLDAHDALHAPAEEREATELEVALHRARALLGEKEIRLRHIERALHRLAAAGAPPPHLLQEVMTTSDASSGSEVDPEAAVGVGTEISSGAEVGAGREGGRAVLRSLRALHADVRDIWRALDARRPHTCTASPESSSCNAASASQARMTLSAPEQSVPDNSDGGVAERARGLRAWLQTAP